MRNVIESGAFQININAGGIILACVILGPSVLDFLNLQPDLAKMALYLPTLFLSAKFLPMKSQLLIAAVLLAVE